MYNALYDIYFNPIDYFFGYIKSKLNKISILNEKNKLDFDLICIFKDMN
jgi:hypothetical protein